MKSRSGSGAGGTLVMVIVAPALLGAGAATSWAGGGPDLAPVTYRKVILEGEQAPGLPEGVTIKTLGSVVAINDSGQTAFWAEIEGPGVTPQNGAALFTEHSDALDLVYRLGDPIPGADFPFAIVNGPATFTSTGLVALPLQFVNESSEFAAIVRLRDGVADVLALEGAPIDGAGIGGVVASLFGVLPEAAGDIVAANVLMTDKGQLIEHVIRFDMTGAASLMMSGAEAPGIESGELAAFLIAGVSPEGDVGIGARVTTPGGFADALYVASNGVVEALARTGDELASHPGETFTSLWFDPQASSAFRFDNGMILAPAKTSVDTLATNALGTIRATDKGINAFALGGQALDEGDDILDFLPFTSMPWSAGDTSAVGIAAASVPGAMVILHNDLETNATSLLLATGMAAPGAPEHVIERIVFHPCANDQDRVLMGAQSISETNANDLFFVRTMDGQIQARLKPGDAIEVAPDDVRVFQKSAAMGPTPQVRGENCMFMPFNNHGQTAQVIEFTDGSRGVFAINIAVSAPTPDLDSNEVVNGADLAALLASWGACATPFAPCAADLNNDGVINGADLAALLAAWGG